MSQKPESVMQRRGGPQPTMPSLLQGGDRRSIGRANEIAAAVRANPRLFGDLMTCLWSDDPLVSMRAADAAEKVTRENPALLRPFKKELLGLMQEAKQQEVRWHLAAMVPRLPLTANDRRRAAGLLNSYLADRSSIVKTFALQGLADLARQDSGLRSEVIDLLSDVLRKGTAAMKARSRKLLAQLESNDAGTGDRKS